MTFMALWILEIEIRFICHFYNNFIQFLSLRNLSIIYSGTHDNMIIIKIATIFTMKQDKF